MRNVPFTALIAILTGVAVAQPGFGQVLVNGLPPASSDVAAAVQTANDAKAMAAAACVATPSVPSMEMVGGSAGTNAGKCRPIDTVQPRITRTASCSLVLSGGIGSCDATWDGSSFAVGTTVRLAGSPAVSTASQGTATEQPVTCKAYNITIAGISFRCWQAQSSLVSILGATVIPFAAPAAGISVSVTALPSS